MTDEELKDEIIFDAFRNAAEREGLFKLIGKKDKNLLERFVSWAKAVLDKFTDWFRKPDRGLTTAQAKQMQAAFGKIIRSLTDSKGNKIFRVNNQTHVIEHIDGRTLKTWNFDAKAGYSFAGKKAKNANLARLEKAKEMETQGYSRKEIHKATAWFKGKDDQWRFEIADDLEKMNFTPLRTKGVATLGEIYDNPALYEAYPELKDMKVSDKFGLLEFFTQGSYDPKTRTIKVRSGSNEKDAYRYHDVLIHEIQHAIQHIEGFAMGGSYETLDRLNGGLKKIEDAIERIRGGAEYFLALTRGKNAPDYNERLKETGQKVSENGRSRIKKLVGQYHRLIDLAMKYKGRARDLYEDLGGEQEADEAAERAKKSRTKLTLQDVESLKWNIQ